MRKSPKFEINATTRKATEMLKLAIQRRTEIEPRLPAGLIDGLGSDLQTLLGKQTQASDAKVEKQALTVSQNDTLVRCANLMTALRKSLRAHHSDKKVLKRFGIGTTLNPRSILSVREAMQTMLNAAREAPEAARQAGILPDDITLIETSLTALAGVDATQEGKKLDARTATAERNAAQLRVEDALAKINGVAGIVYRDNPDMLARFESCMPTPRGGKRTKKPTTTTSDDGPVPPTK